MEAFSPQPLLCQLPVVDYTKGLPGNMQVQVEHLIFSQSASWYLFNKVKKKNNLGALKSQWLQKCCFDKNAS